MPTRESLGPGDAINNRYVCAASSRPSRSRVRSFRWSDCAECAVLQCRTCLRPSAHGFPASKGILGVHEELHVLELNGLVSHVEKVLDLLHREPRHQLFHLFDAATVLIIRRCGPIEFTGAAQDLAIDETAASNVQALALGNIQLYT